MRDSPSHINFLHQNKNIATELLLTDIMPDEVIPHAAALFNVNGLVAVVTGAAGGEYSVLSSRTESSLCMYPGQFQVSDF